MTTAAVPVPLARQGGGVRVAVVVPCFDEALTVGGVVDGVRAALPGAQVHVVDNASTDGTAAVAAAHGAVVHHEPRPGKGRAVRRAFEDVEADVYVLVDGDGTYDAAAAGALVDLLLAGGHDVVVGTRRPDTATAHRPGHAAGNRALNGLVNGLFGTGYTDMLSGYRVMSRAFVASFPARSAGFEVETEMAVHAAVGGFSTLEVPLGFTDRPAGSVSKLRTVRDGLRIAACAVRLRGSLRGSLGGSRRGSLRGAAGAGAPTGSTVR